MTHFTATIDMEMPVFLELQAFIIRHIYNSLYFSIHFHEMYYSFLMSFEHINFKGKGARVTLQVTYRNMKT